MDIVDQCITAISEYTLRKVKKEISETISYLQETREDFFLAISDREWFFDFVVYRFDLRWKMPEKLRILPIVFFQKEINEQDIWNCIDEIIPSSCYQDLEPLKMATNKDPWWAVKIREKIYCCGCRSLYEGIALTESQMKELREENKIFCSECEGDL